MGLLIVPFPYTPVTCSCRSLTILFSITSVYALALMSEAKFRVHAKITGKLSLSSVLSFTLLDRLWENYRFSSEQQQAFYELTVFFVDEICFVNFLLKYSNIFYVLYSNIFKDF